VAWEHNPGLGTPAEGPYGAWIIGSDRLEALRAAAPEAPYLWIPDEALRVGDVVVHEGPYEVSPGLRVGPNAATVEFTVPDVAPGRYDLLHCDDPCTTSLGDITWGVFEVLGPDAAEAPVTTFALPGLAASPSTEPAAPAPVDPAEPPTVVSPSTTRAAPAPATSASTGRGAPAATVAPAADGAAVAIAVDEAGDGGWGWARTTAVVGASAAALAFAAGAGVVRRRR
jgi:hypothetical protein